MQSNRRPYMYFMHAWCFSVSIMIVTGPNGLMRAWGNWFNHSRTWYLFLDWIIINLLGMNWLIGHKIRWTITDQHLLVQWWLVEYNWTNVAKTGKSSWNHCQIDVYNHNQNWELLHAWTKNCSQNPTIHVPWLEKIGHNTELCWWRKNC